MNCVLPECAIAKKVLSYGAGRDDRGQTYRSSHTAVVFEPSMCRHSLRTQQYTKVKIGEPSMCRHSLGTRETKRSSMGHMDDVIDISSVYLCSCIASRDDRRRYNE
jgi:hypothetical protein